MAKTHSVEFTNSIKIILDRHTINYYLNEEIGKIELEWDCKKFRLKHIHIIVRVLKDGLRIYATPDLSIDIDDFWTFNRAAEYICRANNDFCDGLFTIFFDTGLIAFKMSM